jgi:hypothetical protein
MAGRFRRPRIIIISAIIVALSVGIVFSALPLLQHPIAPHGSLTTPVTQTVGPGDSTYPGHSALRLPALPITESFVVALSVTNGNATFCVIDSSNYTSWSSANFAFSSLQSGSCILYETTAQDTITFTPTIAGDWYIVALNTSQKTLTVLFSPA